MQGFVDIEIESGTINALPLMSNRGIQVMNPSRCRLNFYRDSDKNIPCFAMISGMYCQIYQNINISGTLYVEAIGLEVGQKAIITINFM